MDMNSCSIAKIALFLGSFKNGLLLPLGDRFDVYLFLRVQMNSYFWNHILFYICLQTPINRMYPHGANIKGNGKIMDFAHTWVGGSTHG